MKYLAVVFISCCLLFPVFNQTTTQEKTNSSTKPVKKPTPTSSAASKKPGSSKSNSPSNQKPKAIASKTTTASKANSSSGPGSTKPNNIARTTATSSKQSVSSKEKPTASKPGEVAKKAGSSTRSGAAKSNNEPPAQPEIPEGQAEFDACIAIVDITERVAALRKFLTNFPLSTLQTAARELIVTAMVEAGNNAIRAGDMTAASTAFVQAAKDAPVPISDKLFTESLARLSTNLFFRGEKDSAIIIARVLEGKCVTSSSQLISIAEFYVSIESGSEAKRLAKSAIEAAPNSSGGYQMLGLANRVTFQLEESAAAYAKAVEIEPESVPALRGLAEMKRALGKPDEAVELYRRILAKDEASSPAKTGLILSLFENGKREEAEAAMADSLTANPGNIMLLAGAAYWYAAHNEGQKAVDTAQRAISADPRFIWSHIALARGYMAQGMPLAAEKTLLTARRYGNFPTIDYEIASARAMAGFYREAAEELGKSFTVKDGVVSTRLGGQVVRDSSDLMELVSLERRASIAAPQAADTQENARQLTALLDLWTKLNAEKVEPGAIGKAADEFVRGDDKMKAHRQLFAANALLDRKKELPKVIELARAAVANAEVAVDVPSPSAAVLADELYESRRLAMLKDEYITVPDLPRATLLAIIRGRIEDISGWALFQSDNVPESIIRLRRATSVLPADSTWWRSTTWRLGSIYESRGQDLEALEAYFKSYRSGQPDAFKYSIIAAVYKRVNGSTFGLDLKIGANPAGPVPEVSARKSDPPAIPAASPVNIGPAVDRSPEPRVIEPKTDPTPTSPIKVSVEDTKTDVAPTPSPTPVKSESATERAEPKTEIVTPAVKTEPTPEPSPSVVKAEATPEPTPMASKSEPTPEPTPPLVKSDPTPEPTPPIVKTEPTPEPTSTPVTESAAKDLSVKTTESVVPQPSPEPTKAADPPVTVTEVAKRDTSPDPRSSAKDSEQVAKLVDPAAGSSGSKPTDIRITGSAPSASTPKDLFPPVIITVPAKDPVIKTSKNNEPASSNASSASDNTKAKSPEAGDTKTDDKGAPVASQTSIERPRLIATAPPPQCPLVLSENSLSLQNNKGELAVIVRTEDDRDLSDLTASSHSPKDVYVRLEPITGISGRALFIVRSISKRPGIYQVTFALPCGKKDLVVKVH